MNQFYEILMQTFFCLLNCESFIIIIIIINNNIIIIIWFVVISQILHKFVYLNILEYVHTRIYTFGPYKFKGMYLGFA